MPRPRRCRRVEYHPDTTYFKPAGISKHELGESTLTLDEYEAVRLKDLEGLDQNAAAEKMQISQPTFHRLVTSARNKLADAIVNGKAIKIHGGAYKMVSPRAGRQGRGMGFGGPADRCRCPKCGYEQPKQRGVRCMDINCPKCSTNLIRAN